MAKPELPAMCPECGGNGCATCDGTGQVTFGLAEGYIYTRLCRNCGEFNGGYITHELLDGKPVTEGESPLRSTLCVWCGSNNVVWQLVGDTYDDVLRASEETSLGFLKDEPDLYDNDLSD